MTRPPHPSTTALMTSLIRAVHARCDRPTIFDDPHGDELVGPAERGALLERLLLMLAPAQQKQVRHLPDPARALDSAVRANPAYAGVVVRSRYSEDELLRAIGEGVRQYLLVGAGFDTFPFRRADVAARLQVFEIDRAETLAFKRDRLAAAGLRSGDNVHRVAADLETDSIGDALSGCPYSPDTPVFVACLGVTPYLTSAATVRVLRSIAACAAPGSEVVFDYLDPDAVAPQRADAAIRRVAAERATSDEPWRSGLDPAELRGQLRAAGWELVEDLDSDALQARYCAGRSDGLAVPRHMHLSRARVAAS